MIGQFGKFGDFAIDIGGFPWIELGMGSTVGVGILADR
jgi:hypothetical protein